MDDDMQAASAGDIELERRLEAFGRARLSPDPAAAARTRSRVMREARLQHEASRIAAYVGPAVAGRRSLGRRTAMPFLAACVWVGIAVGTISAAQPGGALYPTRMWVEAAVMPSSGGERVHADLARLDDRISEALAAANRGDRSALEAALDAYSAIADDATATAGDDATLASGVEQALNRHLAVLTALVAGLTDKGNATAAAAIDANVQRAIQHNADVLANLAARQAAGHGPGSAGSGSGAGATGGGTTDGGASAGSTGGGSGPSDGAGNGTSGGGKGGTGGDGTSGGGGKQNGAGGDGGNNGNGGNGVSGAQPTPEAVASPAQPDHTPRSGR
jgi:hypothetical protein